ncbi:hypothetical protein SYNTR_0913 [Candidatus Syntrophocurvum alkaliphilum]|uniref:Ig-like domain-containing protein n=1 Tax=Candidatus Syntrophocurvum alkaliphilum TaxID=2293317 RepID=A0A6I6DE44_9FIRM|nr:hypothetical protein [Candidatus Syntrophocurvum alkaliphilum]QGT99506.1 hypothetical protein SYNTR_0913 [Candidatus Syntrophocurvum alkaliphilum]
MTYNTKNYTEQGGEKTIISGELNIIEQGKLMFNGEELSQALYQSNSQATTIAGLVADFNKLLVKLRSAGVMFSKAPVITILIEPEDVIVTEGSIEESLTVDATVSNGSELSYQWYSNNTESNEDGTLIEGATEAVFDLPTNLTEGTIYYYCVITAEEAPDVTSEVASVTVEGD